MSMEIDFATPLTDKERAFLEERGRYADIERSDNAHGVAGPELGEGDGTGTQQRPVLTSEVMAARREQLLAELKALGPAEDETPEDDEEAVPYEKWKPAELKTEAERRGLDGSGTKQVLVDRLYTDDEQAAAQVHAQQ